MAAAFFVEKCPFFAKTCGQKEEKQRQILSEDLRFKARKINKFGCFGMFMLVGILVAIIIGVHAGCLTGLTPGIHVNLVALLLLSSVAALSLYFSPLQIAIVIISTALTHTFLDSIPSIFLGAPDSDMALGVLPGHRYLLRGLGLMAVKLTLIGSFGAIVLSVLLFPALVVVVKKIYPILKEYIGIILIVIVIFMILRDNKKLWALLVFILSGLVGLVVLNLPNAKDPLFPLLRGGKTLLYTSI